MKLRRLFCSCLPPVFQWLLIAIYSFETRVWFLGRLIRKPIFTGLDQLLSSDKRAESLYETIRSLKNDSSNIAQKTGIPEYIIRAVRSHVFEETHAIQVGPEQTVTQRFDAQLEIANWWLTLARKKSLSPEDDQQFREFVAHEYIEHALMKHGGLPFRSPDARAWKLENGQWVNYCTSQAYGAHDLAPRPGTDPWGHYTTVLGRPK